MDAARNCVALRAHARRGTTVISAWSVQGAITRAWVTSGGSAASRTMIAWLPSGTVERWTLCELADDWDAVSLARDRGAFMWRWEQERENR
jgi:hypothetical protein